jgi:hypothetical protein
MVLPHSPLHIDVYMSTAGQLGAKYLNTDAVPRSCLADVEPPSATAIAASHVLLSTPDPLATPPHAPQVTQIVQRVSRHAEPRRRAHSSQWQEISPANRPLHQQRVGGQ